MISYELIFIDIFHYIYICLEYLDLWGFCYLYKVVKTIEQLVLVVVLLLRMLRVFFQYRVIPSR